MNTYDPDDVIVTYNGISFKGSMKGPISVDIETYQPSTEFYSLAQCIGAQVHNEIAKLHAAGWLMNATTQSDEDEDDLDDEDFDEDDEDFDEDDEGDFNEDDSEEEDDDERVHFNDPSRVFGVEQIIIDDPVSVKPAAIVFYACINLTCPRRQPVTAAQRCYTCGEAYSTVPYELSYSAIDRVDVEPWTRKQFGVDFESKVWTWKPSRWNSY